MPTIYGLDVIVDDLDEMVSGHIKNIGTWEPNYIRAMAKLVKEGDVLLNIGSHIGLEMIVLGRGVGPKGKMYLFEPLDFTYAMLIKNVYLNQLEDITVAYKMGAGKAYSKGISEVTTQNTGGSRISTDPNFQAVPKPLTTYHEIVVDRADNVLPKDVKFDFALIDPEFMELEVMEGMTETIARSPNMIIMIEWWGQYYLKNGMTEKMKKVGEKLKELESRNFKFYYASFTKDSCAVTFIQQTYE